MLTSRSERLTGAPTARVVGLLDRLPDAYAERWWGVSNREPYEEAACAFAIFPGDEVKFVDARFVLTSPLHVTLARTPHTPASLSGLGARLTLGPGQRLQLAESGGTPTNLVGFPNAFAQRACGPLQSREGLSWVHPWPLIACN